MTTTMLLSASEIRESARSRWVPIAAAGFALVSAALTFTGNWGGGEGFGPAAAGLIDVELIAVPLFALILGAIAVARDRERGTYGYLRSLPVTLDEIYASKVLGIGASVTAVVFGGFAGAFAAMFALGQRGDVWPLVQFALLTWLLGIACSAIGIVISACAKRFPAALGGAIATWLLLVIFGDLGIMATALATRMSLPVLFAITAINPIEAYKIAALSALSGSVDVLGPGGRLAADMLGVYVMPVMAGALGIWTLLALAAGRFVLQRRRDA